MATFRETSGEVSQVLSRRNYVRIETLIEKQNAQRFGGCPTNFSLSCFVKGLWEKSRP
jgi:hypothetical protein